MIAFEALATQDGAAVALGALAAVVAFGLGLALGRRRRKSPAPPAAAETVSDYALDYGMVGRKRAKAIRKVAQSDWAYIIYETDYLDYGKWPVRHVMEVPVSMGAVDYLKGVVLNPVESGKIERGDDWAYFETLARQVQDDPSRFRGVHVDTSALDAEREGAG